MSGHSIDKPTKFRLFTFRRSELFEDDGLEMCYNLYGLNDTTATLSDPILCTPSLKPKVDPFPSLYSTPAMNAFR